MISQFAVRLPISCAARLICHSFCLIPLNHTLFQFLINTRGCNCFVNVISIFINVSSAGSGCSSIHTTDLQIFFISSTYEHNCMFTYEHTIVWPLIHYIRPSLWNFGFPRYGYYIVLITSNGSGDCFHKWNTSHFNVTLRMFTYLVLFISYVCTVSIYCILAALSLLIYIFYTSTVPCESIRPPWTLRPFATFQASNIKI